MRTYLFTSCTSTVSLVRHSLAVALHAPMPGSSVTPSHLVETLLRTLWSPSVYPCAADAGRGYAKELAHRLTGIPTSTELNLVCREAHVLVIINKVNNTKYNVTDVSVKSRKSIMYGLGVTRARTIPPRACPTRRCATLRVSTSTMGTAFLVGCA